MEIYMTTLNIIHEKKVFETYSKLPYSNDYGTRRNGVGVAVHWRQGGCGGGRG